MNLCIYPFSKHQWVSTVCQAPWYLLNNTKLNKELLAFKEVMVGEVIIQLWWVMLLKWQEDKRGPCKSCRSKCNWHFPGGALVKILPANAEDARVVCSVLGWGRSPGRGNDNPLQYSHLKIPWIEEPGSLQSMESQGLDMTERTHTHTHTHTWSIIEEKSPGVNVF